MSCSGLKLEKSPTSQACGTAMRQAPDFPPKASFRKSVGRLEIEDAPVRKTLWARLKRLFAKNP